MEASGFNMQLLGLLFLCLVTVVSASPLFYGEQQDAECKFTLVESIPENLTFNSSVSSLPTYDAYQTLISLAAKEINFASFYWTLRGYDVMKKPGNLASKGEELLQSLIDKSQTVPVKIATNVGSFKYNESDLQLLSQQPLVQIVGVNISGIFGSGVLHTKFVVADSAHAYMGSSNMDWRSLTQIKELGLLMTNCPTLSTELAKVFTSYWLTGQESHAPYPWPDSLTSSINATNPWVATVDGHEYSVYIGVSPVQLCPPGWSRDIDAIVDAILSARKFVHVAVMEYQAATVHEGGHRSFWDTIDGALKTAAFKGVWVRLLVSRWSHSDPYVRRFVDSLTALNANKSQIEGKFFVVPAFTPEQQRVPFGRVNHSKFMVTESTAVICTSNWDGSYFENTAGTAIYIRETGNSTDRNDSPSIVEEVQALFQRDWDSSYAHWH